MRQMNMECPNSHVTSHHSPVEELQEKEARKSHEIERRITWLDYEPLPAISTIFVFSIQNYEIDERIVFYFIKNKRVVIFPFLLSHLALNFVLPTEIHSSTSIFCSSFEHFAWTVVHNHLSFVGGRGWYAFHPFDDVAHSPSLESPPGKPTPDSQVLVPVPSPRQGAKSAFADTYLPTSTIHLSPGFQLTHGRVKMNGDCT